MKYFHLLILMHDFFLTYHPNTSWPEVCWSSSSRLILLSSWRMTLPNMTLCSVSCVYLVPTKYLVILRMQKVKAFFWRKAVWCRQLYPQIYKINSRLYSTFQWRFLLNIPFCWKLKWKNYINQLISSMKSKIRTVIWLLVSSSLLNFYGESKITD